MFESNVTEALLAFDKVIRLDCSDIVVDGSLRKSPASGEGTGGNPTDRGKIGWNWSKDCSPARIHDCLHHRREADRLQEPLDARAFCCQLNHLSSYLTFSTKL